MLGGMVGRCMVCWCMVVCWGLVCGSLVNYGGIFHLGVVDCRFMLWHRVVRGG